MSDLLTTMYLEWRRLKGYPPPPKTAIDAMVDDAAGVGLESERVLAEFGEFFRDAIMRCGVARNAIGDAENGSDAASPGLARTAPPQGSNA